MRHAEAEHGAASDHDRRLTEHGRTQASDVGVWLRQQRISFDSLVASSARRTCETAQLVRDALAQQESDTHDVKLLGQLYNGPMSAYFDAVGEFDDTWSDVLIVGHNPAVGELASRAAGRRVAVVTATVAEIHLPDWSSLAEAGEAARVCVPGGHDLLTLD